MTLEEAASWTGTMTDLGPLYPGVGTEVLLVLIGVAFWVIWHIVQFRMETRNYEDDLRTLRQKDNMERALRGEKILKSM